MDERTNRLAQALMGPRQGTLSPGQENEFQTFMAFDPNVRQWRNALQNQYGEQPRIEGGDYDYRAAWAAGSRPQPVPGDTIPHWSSVGKAADHPTMWKQDFMTQFGVDPDQAAQTGFTAPQSQMVNQQIYNDLLVRALMGSR